MNEFNPSPIIVKVFISNLLLENNPIEFSFEVVSNLTQKLICKYIASQTALIQFSIPEPKSILDTKQWLGDSSKKQITILDHQDWLKLLESFSHKDIILEKDKNNKPCAFLLWPKQY